MDTRWMIQGVLLSVVASSLAQNFQPQNGGFQPQTSGFQPQNGGFQPQSGGFQSQRAPQGLTDEQREALKAQDDFRNSVAEANRAAVLRPKRPEQLAVRTPQQNAQQVQANAGPTQGFQGPQPQTRSQAPVRQQQPRPAVRQQPRQPVRPPPQAFEQPPAPRQQFDQPTAQQVNQQFFDQPAPQQFERPVEAAAPVAVVRRPAQAVARQQAQQTQQAQQAPASQFDPELFQQQAENARYSFATAVTDTINDQENVREETRDGLNLRGLYSYSDGYFKRTVHYEADENGYRVTKEEVDTIGDGPRGDPNGRAQVSSSVEGNNLQYTITAADIPGRRLEPHQPHQPHQVQQVQQAPREQAFAPS